MHVEDLNQIVDQKLRDLINERELPLYRIIEYQMGWNDSVEELSVGNDEVLKGNELISNPFGVLCLLASSSNHTQIKDAIKPAVSIEMISKFLQIHDDIQSGNPSRNGRDTVWWLWGPAQAINAGDGLHALARLTILQMHEDGYPSENIFQMLSILDQATLKACEGRYLDLEAQESIDMNIQNYLQMSGDRLGSVFSCALQLGYIINSNNPAKLNVISSCGNALGIALQIATDINIIWADGSDIELLNKKKILPVVLGMSKASISEKRKLGDIFFKRVLESSDVVSIREILEDLDIKNQSFNLLEDYKSQCQKGLKEIFEDSQKLEIASSYVNNIIDNGIK